MKVPWVSIVAALKRVIQWLRDSKESEAAPEEPRGIGRWWRWAVNRTTGRLALLTIGQSDYRGKANNLPGCALDARNMARTFSGYGAKVTEKHNIGRAETLSEIKKVLDMHAGGTTVIHYSGHGSQVADRTGTEPDGKMEVICCADLGLIGDDDLLAMAAAAAARGGNVILIYDTCHSGGMARAIGAESQEVPAFARYVPESIIPAFRLEEYLSYRLTRGPVNADPTTITVMMACEEQSYSYDSMAGGAYTSALIRVLGRLGNARAKDVHAAIRKCLPSPSFPQAPQFAGRGEVRIFG